jgi:hypothetical protein
MEIVDSNQLPVASKRTSGSAPLTMIYISSFVVPPGHDGLST